MNYLRIGVTNPEIVIPSKGFLFFECLYLFTTEVLCTSGKGTSMFE